MARYFLIAAGLLALAGVPGAFAAEFHHDYAGRARERAVIRRDENRLHRDLARGNYREAARDRAVLRRDERFR
jgi:hypothetical protein